MNLTLIQNLYFPTILYGLHADVYHACSPLEAYPLILVRKKPTIVTYHDVFCWSSPREYLPDRRTRAYRQFVRFYESVVLKRADFLICVSKSVKRSLQRFFRIPDRRIKVIPYGLTPKFRVLGRKEEVKRKMGLGDNPFVLQVPGRITQDEAVDLAIRAFYKVKKRPDAPSGLKLSIIGYCETRRLNYYLELVKGLGLEDDISFPGYISDEELVNYYNAADLLVHPTLANGGILPIEAMACGTPVITTNVGSLPDVVDNAAILIPPGDVNALAHSLIKLLRDDGLREEMIRKGLKRAKQFSWDKTAKETREIYEYLGGKCRSRKFLL